MNIDNTDVFDDMLRKKADSEKTAAPEQLTVLVKNVISVLPDRSEASKSRSGFINVILQFLQKMRVKDFLEVAAVALALVLIPYIVSTQKWRDPVQSNRLSSSNNVLKSLRSKDVEWLALSISVPNNSPSYLFSGKDDKRIADIIGIFRESSGFRKAREEELNGSSIKGGGTREIILKLKDGRKYYLMTAYKREEIKDNGQSGFSFPPYTDRFILTDDSNGRDYYTLFSEDAAKYLLNASEADFPKEKEYEISPDNFKLGDRITVSGSGCTESKVEIGLWNRDKAIPERYIIGRVVPTSGEWKWEGTLTDNIKTWNGDAIHFTSSKIFLFISIGEKTISPGNELHFTISANETKGLSSGNNVLAGLKAGNIEWITKTGVSPGSKYSVLFADKFPENIPSIIDIFKKSSGLRAAQEYELNGLAMKGGGPPSIVLQLRNGHQYNLMAAYGPEYKPYSDRFIIQDSCDANHFYTLFSEDAAAYIVKGSNADFHLVEEYAISPVNYESGDYVTITGSDCTESEVNICLESADPTVKEKYVIGKVNPDLGDWRWEGILESTIQTWEGQNFNLKGKKMILSIYIGNRRYSLSNELNY